MVEINKHEVAVEAIKAAPPVTVTGMTLFGYELQSWMLLCTIVYTLLLIVTQVIKIWQMVRSKKNAKTDIDPI